MKLSVSVTALLVIASLSTTALASANKNKGKATDDGGDNGGPSLKRKPTGMRIVDWNSPAHIKATVNEYTGVQRRRAKVRPINNRNHDNKKHRNAISAKGSYVVQSDDQ